MQLSFDFDNLIPALYDDTLVIEEHSYYDESAAETHVSQWRDKICICNNIY